MKQSYLVNIQGQITTIGRQTSFACLPPYTHADFNKIHRIRAKNGGLFSSACQPTVWVGQSHLSSRGERLDRCQLLDV